MQTRVSSYQDYTIRFPKGIDTTPLNAFVKAMGWNIYVVSPAAMEEPVKENGLSRSLASLRGVAKGAVANDVPFDEMKRRMMEDKFGKL